MSNAAHVDKTHVQNPIYNELPLQCPLCKKIQKISRVFKKPYTLLYHLSTKHNKEDENITSISISEIKLAISGVVTAHDLQMFDIVKRGFRY